MPKELAKAYDPKNVEEAIYRRWEESGFFNPDKLPPAPHPLSPKPFTIIMPPPNANGSLHLGHAVFVTLQDIMIRFQRMRGRKTLWLPGADHAGFETQYVYDKKLEKEGKRRSDFSREELYRKIWEFTQANKAVMEDQLRKLGASCDWSRERFTLDPEIVKIVQDTFVQLYNDGLIYRGTRIINWSVKDQTALSDLEIRYEERIDPLYYIQYGPLALATVRPETKFGDTAVAVHPKDTRYQKYVGQEIEIETLLGPAKLKVIADDAVDPEFGTGVVKVTPAHDPADFEMGLRHNLEVRPVIDRYGKMNEKAGPYAGLKVEEARKRVVEDMQKRGLITKIEENYKHSVAVSVRSGGMIEPMVMPQWFVAMTKLRGGRGQGAGGKKSLRDMAVEAVKKGQIKFIPKRTEKVFFHWMKNLRDWNISRQIIWGIRIPAWFHEPVCIPKPGREADIEKCVPIVVAASMPACAFCDAKYVQDPDVLDTWFSSGQWPYAALLANAGKQSGNSKLTSKDFDAFYPTDVMETGYDILFFWVARMIMFGLYRTGKVPFKTVYLHGLVRDKDRQKMSKSKGNAIDPLGVAEQYGTDAVRMALVVGNTAGNDIIISEEKIRGYRNFANKLWNIHRFIMLKAFGGVKGEGGKTKAAYTVEDKKWLTELQEIAAKVTRHLERFEFHHAAETIYHYTWHTFADKIIEAAKPRLESRDARDREAAQSLLLEIHTSILTLLHPFMPYITEELWGHLQEVKSSKSKTKSVLMVESWPH